MAASEERRFFSKQSTTGDPKLKPFCQRPKKGTYVVLRCPLEDRALGKNTFDWLMLLLTWSYTRGTKFTKNKYDQWSSAANPWYSTHRVLQGTEASLLELRRFMTLGGAGFRDSPNTTGWPRLAFQGLAPMDQLSKSRTQNNLQAKYRTPQMPLAARHWLSEGSESRSQ